jgi:hypothetical protein
MTAGPGGGSVQWVSARGQDEGAHAAEVIYVDRLEGFEEGEVVFLHGFGQQGPGQEKAGRAVRDLVYAVGQWAHPVFYADIGGHADEQGALGF